MKIFLTITIFSVSPCNPSEHLPLLFAVNPMKEAPKGTKIPQFWHLSVPVDSQPCNQFSFSGYESNFFFLFFFLCLFPYLHNGDKTSPSPMDNYQIKSPVYEMLQSETSRTIVEPWGATTLSRQQHLWTKKTLLLLQRNKANILHSCIFRKINTQYLNRELPPHDKNPCQVSFLQHNEVIVLLRPQSTKTQQFPHGEIAT